MAGLSQLEAMVSRYQGNPVLSAEFVVSELQWISHCFSEVYIIVDGLDECSGREIIHPNLVRLAERARVLVTSRPETDIVSAFSAQTHLNIDEGVKRDILTHVQWQMDNNKKFSHIRPSLKQKIEVELVARSAGMYFDSGIRSDY